MHSISRRPGKAGLIALVVFCLVLGAASVAQADYVNHYCENMGIPHEESCAGAQAHQGYSYQSATTNHRMCQIAEYHAAGGFYTNTLWTGGPYEMAFWCSTGAASAGYYKDLGTGTNWYGAIENTNAATTVTVSQAHISGPCCP